MSILLKCCATADAYASAIQKIGQMRTVTKCALNRNTVKNRNNDKHRCPRL